MGNPKEREIPDFPLDLCPYCEGTLTEMEYDTFDSSIVRGVLECSNCGIVFDEWFEDVGGEAD